MRASAEDPARPVVRAAVTPVALLLTVLLAAGCAATAAPGRPAAPEPPEVTAPLEPSAATVVPPSPAAAGIACGGRVHGASPSGAPAVWTRPPMEHTLVHVLGTAAALGFGLLGDGPGCGGRVILAPAGDPGARVHAATAAILRDVPLLLLPGDARGEPDLLPPVAGTLVRRRLDALGIVHRDEYRPAASVEEASRALLDLLDLLAEAGPPDGGLRVARIVLVAADDPTAQAEAVAQVPAGVLPLVVDLAGLPDLGRLLAPFRELEPELPLGWAASTPRAEAAFAAGDVEGLGLSRWAPMDGTAGPSGREPVELWLADLRDPGAALTAAVTAARRGGALAVVDGADLRSGAARTVRIRALADTLPEGAPVVLVGGGEDAGWQLDTVLTGTPLPGGGFLPLEDRRIVALYGTPGAPGLGVLGEQDLEATLVRAREFAAGYVDAADGREVVPGLDVITTVASAGAEPTGDYSRRVPIERLRPLVDRAREEGMAVFLDLQPGRTAFLAQAQEYEELLREPHVHLALDPEWRIGPTERHLQRIGSVAAAEVQEVADWLAALVRAERLPQKVLMLHQFTRDMLRDRDTIVIPPELVGVVHVDGQGPLPTKDRTYAAMTVGAEERWAWGWKNFTRIDVPLATPERTLDRSPVPVVITYQ